MSSRTLRKGSGERLARRWKTNRKTATQEQKGKDENEGDIEGLGKRDQIENGAAVVARPFFTRDATPSGQPRPSPQMRWKCVTRCCSLCCTHCCKCCRKVGESSLITGGWCHLWWLCKTGLCCLCRSRTLFALWANPLYLVLVVKVWYCVVGSFLDYSAWWNEQVRFFGGRSYLKGGGSLLS